MPCCGLDRPTSIRMVVVFPDPFGPSNAQICPGSTVKLMSVTPRRRPYRLPSRSAPIAGAWEESGSTRRTFLPVILGGAVRRRCRAEPRS